MRRLRYSGPSPALAVAILALAAALAGTAVAEQATTSKATTKKVKKIAKKQAKQQIEKLAPGLSVANAQIGQSLVAYAHVNADGSADAAHSRGLSNANIVADPPGADPGTYCIKGLTGVKSAMVVADTSGGNRHATIRVGDDAIAQGCNVAGTQFAVSTFGLDAAGESAFFIWFFN